MLEPSGGVRKGWRRPWIKMPPRYSGSPSLTQVTRILLTGAGIFRPSFSQIQPSLTIIIIIVGRKTHSEGVRCWESCPILVGCSHLGLFVFSTLLWQIFFQLGRKENVLTANWKEAPAWPRKLAVDVTFRQIFIYHQVRRPWCHLSSGGLDLEAVRAVAWSLNEGVAQLAVHPCVAVPSLSFTALKDGDGFGSKALDIMNKWVIRYHLIQRRLATMRTEVRKIFGDVGHLCAGRGEGAGGWWFLNWAFPHLELSPPRTPLSTAVHITHIHIALCTHSSNSEIHTFLHSPNLNQKARFNIDTIVHWKKES